MEALSINLGIIFGLQILNGSILKVGPAYIWTWFKSKEWSKQHARKWIWSMLHGNDSNSYMRIISRPETEFLLIQVKLLSLLVHSHFLQSVALLLTFPPPSQHDTQALSISNYMNIVIQFGYMALFITAMPMAALFVLLFNVITLLCDVSATVTHLSVRYAKLTGTIVGVEHVIRVPKTAAEIIRFYRHMVRHIRLSTTRHRRDVYIRRKSMFMVIVVAAVITNAGITVFTLTQFDFFSPTEKFWLFVIFQWSCFSVQALLIYLVPATPWEVQIQSARAKFLVSKLINREPDKLRRERNYPFPGEIGVFEEDEYGPIVRVSGMKGESYE